MPLLWLSISFVCGVVLGAWLDPAQAIICGCAAAGLIWLIIPPLVRRSPLGRRRAPAAFFRISQFLSPLNQMIAPLPVAALLLALAIGAERFDLSRFVLSPNQAAWYNDRDEQVILEGWIAGPPEWRDQYTLLEVEATRVSVQGEAGRSDVEGRLLAKVPPGEWRYGDQVLLNGRLRTPFENEDFSYLDYLAHRGIHATFDCGYHYDEKCIRVMSSGEAGSGFYRWIYTLRERFVSIIYQIFPDPEASLMSGILFGVEGGIPETVREAFNATGTSHVIAISGYSVEM
jgi:competence protein ComEC